MHRILILNIKESMKIALIRQRIKPLMMPIAILAGIFFHKQIEMLGWIVPYLIFAMLLLTFCRIKPRELRFSHAMWWLLLMQVLGAVAMYFIVRPFNVTLAEGAMVCVLCPVATAAPVVTGLLGGDIAKVATFSVLSNLAVALVAPAWFAWIHPDGSGVDFVNEFLTIAFKVVPIIVFPLLAAFLLYFTLPKVHSAVAGAAPLAFYMWSVSLIVVVGRSVSFIISEPASYRPVMIMLGILAAVACALQFIAGKALGKTVNDRITYGQSMGQKNTVLAIWLALTYLEPVSCVAPAAYVLWQNCFNSLQLYVKIRRDGK